VIQRSRADGRTLVDARRRRGGRETPALAMQALTLGSLRLLLKNYGPSAKYLLRATERVHLERRGRYHGHPGVRWRDSIANLPFFSQSGRMARLV